RRAGREAGGQLVADHAHRPPPWPVVPSRTIRGKPDSNGVCTPAPTVQNGAATPRPRATGAPMAEQAEPDRDRAVVVGGRIAGLLAARVRAEHFGGGGP